MIEMECTLRTGIFPRGHTILTPFLRSLFQPEVTGEVEVGEAVFFAGALADVVDDEGETLGVFFVADDHDVRQVGRDGAGDEVAREEDVFCEGFIEGDFLMFTDEKGDEVRDATVVDVLVGPFESPVFRISAKAGQHVLMDEFLQVEGGAFAQGANNDIGADSFFPWDIAAGIGEGGVGGIVADGNADLFARGGDDI